MVLVYVIYAITAMKDAQMPCPTRGLLWIYYFSTLTQSGFVLLFIYLGDDFKDYHSFMQQKLILPTKVHKAWECGQSVRPHIYPWELFFDYSLALGSSYWWAKVFWDSKSLRTIGKETLGIWATGMLTLAFTVFGSQSFYSQERYGQRSPEWGLLKHKWERRQEWCFQCDITASIICYLLALWLYSTNY